MTDIEKKLRDVRTALESITPEDFVALARAYDTDTAEAEAICAEWNLTAEAVNCFMTALSDNAFMDEVLIEFCHEVFRTLPDRFIGQLLIALPIIDCPGNADPDGPLDKRLALSVAEALGPDWSQAWYRFAVAVTKMNAIA